MNVNSIVRALMAGAVVVVLAAIGVAWVQTRQAVATTQDNRQALYVQSVESGTFDGEKLSLVNPSGLTLWFSDRPEHRAGYIADADFEAGWTANGDSFASDPPNAVLHTAGDGNEAVLELGALQITAGGLIYKVSSVKGTIPSKFTGAALFIDDGRIPDYTGMGSSTDNLINALGH